ncbi:uncharacterized protein PMUG01_10052100 [Plasmodium malariae]|uniref:Uncharacterized protein n=1 Tax=Plasmodium malariae TaxID=5858 RepID=A0A1A8WVN5_PLAMA|nr:uncharacterized protein PMUG01_10052100 [Plasmodium malariae]SBS97020.1 hypothetical protein PMALA_058620 [Plasmodium malariae]SCN45336.1 hypothetical protein PMUG01_10052100 [Plasmodium malariae]
MKIQKPSNTLKFKDNFKNSLNSEVHDYFEKLLRESKTSNQTNKYMLKEKRSSFITKILKNIDEKYEKEVHNVLDMEFKMYNNLKGITNQIIKKMYKAFIPFLTTNVIVFNLS